MTLIFPCVGDTVPTHSLFYQLNLGTGWELPASQFLKEAWEWTLLDFFTAYDLGQLIPWSLVSPRGHLHPPAVTTGLMEYLGFTPF